MPVKKIRHLQEMEDSLWYEPGSPELMQAIKAVWKFAERTCPQRFPPGVYKHRTIEDAQRQRDLWEDQNFTAFWERRGIDPKKLR